MSWDMLESETWDIEAMYAAHRGAPLSAGPHVMLATPAYNPPGLEFLRTRETVCDDLHRHGIGVSVLTTPGDSLVMRGRHTIVHEFLCSPASHLLFWDVDIEPLDPSVVRHMMAAERPVLGGACPFRNETGRVVCNLSPQDRARKKVDVDEDQCAEVAEIGTGFLLISRQAIVTLCEKHRELLYFSDQLSNIGVPLWALFDTTIENRRYLSEDYFFCRLAREAGMRVSAFVPFEAVHWGRKAFRGQFLTAWGMRQT